MSSQALGPCICNHLLSIKSLRPTKKEAHAACSLADAISSRLFFFLSPFSARLGDKTASIQTHHQPQHSAKLITPFEL